MQQSAVLKDTIIMTLIALTEFYLYLENAIKMLPKLLYVLSCSSDETMRDDAARSALRDRDSLY